MTGMAVKTGVLALALALSGCGGGGGGGDSAPAPDAPVAQRAVQGTAAKGLIKGARIDVHALDPLGVRASSVLASATTGADGTYRLQVPLSVRNFVIEVSAAPGAMMADEASGADLPFPTSLKLRNVVTLAENAGGAYEGSVSPLTEMVARTAETADGKLPLQAVAQAKNSVRTLLGFDPETVKPVNSNSLAAISASEEEKNQSLALAAISKMASIASADCAQSTAGERIACVVTNLAASVTVKDGQPALDPARLAQFRAAIEAVALDKTINRTGKDKVVGIPVLTPAPVTPPPSTPPTPPVGTLTPVEATRALFGSLRTNLRSIGEGDAFQATADAIRADLDRVIAPLGNEAGAIASLGSSAIALLDSVRAGGAYETEVLVSGNEVWPVAAPARHYYLSNGSGSCDIVQHPLGMTCTVVQNKYLPGSTGNYWGGTAVYVTRTLKLQQKEGSTTGYSYTTFLEKNVVEHKNGMAIGMHVKEALGGVFTGEITVVRTGDTVAQVEIKGRMPGRLDASGAFVSDHEDWSLDIVRTPEADGAVLYTFGGGFSATRAGQSAGTIEIDGTSFLRVAPPSSDNPASDVANELQLTLRGNVGSTTVGGTLRLGDSRQDKSGTRRMPTKLSFDGSLDHGDATVFSGHVALTRNGYAQFDATAPESDTNFVADTIDIGGALSVPNRPVLSLTLGATRTGLDAGAISAQYRDGSSVINASVSARAGERHPLVKVASADGVAFSFTNTSAPVQVTKDGAVTALLDLSKGIISYSDGSTESLK
jgi:hypothetical protein